MLTNSGKGMRGIFVESKQSSAKAATLLTGNYFSLFRIRISWFIQATVSQHRCSWICYCRQVETWAGRIVVASRQRRGLVTRRQTEWISSLRKVIEFLSSCCLCLLEQGTYHWVSFLRSCSVENCRELPFYWTAPLAYLLECLNVKHQYRIRQKKTTFLDKEENKKRNGFKDSSAVQDILTAGRQVLASPRL